MISRTFCSSNELQNRWANSTVDEIRAALRAE
jgi:hypothetical protein